MTEIDEDMVEAATKAMLDECDGECVYAGPDGLCDKPLCQCRSEARAALTAILPMLQAKERDRAARIAESHKCETCGRLLHDSEPHTDEECPMNYSSWGSLSQAEIAAAIRGDDHE